MSSQWTHGRRQLERAESARNHSCSMLVMLSESQAVILKQSIGSGGNVRVTDEICTNQLVVDGLVVSIDTNRTLMGRSAALGVAKQIKMLLGKQERINMAFAAAPSQNEFLAELCSMADLDWSRVNAFHLDEYVGLADDAPQRFGNFLKRSVFDKVSFANVHYLNGNAQDLDAECSRYASLLREHPVDIACIGIGENGHIAFNDPHVADFNDPHAVKVVSLDERCRLQQVHDGCFPELNAVPTHALTLTIPAIVAAKWVYCMVPGASKQEAVKATLEGPVSTKCPASVLRRHPRATLFLDSESAGLLTRDGSDTEG